MEDTVYLALMAITIVVVNVIPAFMPPTWMVISAFYIGGDVGLIITCLVGTTASLIGRLGLTLESRYFARWLPASDRRNAAAVAKYLTLHPRQEILIYLAFFAGPLPSNPIFIAAGVARLHMIRICTVFWLSRMVTNIIYVTLAAYVVETMLDNNATTLQKVISGLVALAICAATFLMFRLPWARWLKIDLPELEDSSKAEGSTPA